jgi:hypothetical protein
VWFLVHINVVDATVFCGFGQQQFPLESACLSWQWAAVIGSSLLRVRNIRYHDLATFLSSVKKVQSTVGLLADIPSWMISIHKN